MADVPTEKALNATILACGPMMHRTAQQLADGLNEMAGVVGSEESAEAVQQEFRDLLFGPGGMTDVFLAAAQ